MSLWSHGGTLEEAATEDQLQDQGKTCSLLLKGRSPRDFIHITSGHYYSISIEKVPPLSSFYRIQSKTQVRSEVIFLK